MIHKASSEAAITTIEVHPLMPLTSVQLKSLNTFSENVFLLTSGAVRVKIIAFNPSVNSIRRLEDVSEGLSDAAFGYTHLLFDKEPAAILFGAPPITDELRFDNATFFSWFYSAGGSDLYDEFWDELSLNIKGFILQTSGPRALGWFREPLLSLEDLQGRRFRGSFDYTNEIHKRMGLSIVPMRAADIIPELEKKNLDAASWCCPFSDLKLGLHDSVGNYYLQGISKNILNTDLYLNKDIYKNLSLLQKKAIEVAASASLIEHSSYFIYENGKALKELVENYNVTLHKTPKRYFDKYQMVATKLLLEKAKENDFFAKVWQSQKDFSIVGYPFWSEIRTFEKRIYD